MNKLVNSSSTFKLDDWLVTPSLDRISKGDRHVNLQPQVMNLLVYLADHHNQVVSAEELLANLWKDRIVTSSSVYSSLKQLRAALGDDVQNPSYIKTVPKRGYRLTAKLEFPKSENTTPSSLERHEQGRKTWRNAALFVIVLAIVVSTVFIIRFQEPLNGGTDPREIAPEKSIAVLPFADLSPEQDRGWFSDGMTEEILNKLAQLPDLKVTGRQSSFSFKQSDLDIQTIGKALGVAHLLEGSVRYDGERVRVTAQLIRTEDGFHIWSQAYDRNAVGTIAIQDDISSNIAKTLALKLATGATPGGTSARIVMIPNFSAYELYLQSLALINQNTKLSLMTALSKLKNALELEPEYAEAHVAIARVYLNLTNFTGFYQQDWFGESRAFARPHAEQAIAINPGLAEAYVMLGDLSADIDEVKKYNEKALSLNPNLFRAYIELGISVMGQLRPWSDSLVYLERALEIEPLSVEAATLFVLFLQRFPPRWQEAEDIFANLKEQNPDSDDVKRAWAEWLLNVRGQPSEAIPLLQDLIIRDPDNRWARAWLNRAWYILGETERAMESPLPSPHWRYVVGLDRETSLRQMKEIPEGNKEIDFDRRLVLAYIHIMLRDWQNAIDLLVDDAIDLESFSHSSYVQYFGLNESPAVSLAVAYKGLGDHDNFIKYAEFEEKMLNIRTENGKLHNEEYSRAKARLDSMGGKHYEAMLELEHLLVTGSIDPRDLLHPAFDEIRDTPEFKRLENLQHQRINSERKKLGLAPLTINEPTPET